MSVSNATTPVPVRPVGSSTTQLAPLLVVAWDDPVVDQLGVDPRSSYAEQFWLPLLGPTSMWLVRRLATEFDHSPDGFSLDVIDTARSIGVGTKGGRSGPFPRSIDRCVRFGIASHAEHGILAVRRRIPTLNRAQVRRLPRSLQGAHETWQRERRRRSSHPSHDAHAIRLARTLLALGASAAEVEEQLERWDFNPDAARRALDEALRSHE